MHTSKQLFGMKIHATDGDLGHVEDFYFDDQQWRVKYLVVDTGHWLPGRKVLISPEAVKRLDWAEHSVWLNITRDQVRSSPDIDTARPISAEIENRLWRHYGWTGDWLFPVQGPAAIPSTDLVFGSPEEREAEAEAGHLGGDPHLRSAKEIIGYKVEATDRHMGEVEAFDFTDDLAIPAILIDTGRLLPGKKVEIPVARVKDIEWSQGSVLLDGAHDSFGGPAGPSDLPSYV